MSVDVSKLSDFARATRATELHRGGWLSLVSQLKEYTLAQMFFPRRVERSADRLRWRVTIDTNPNAQSDTDGFVIGAYAPLQVSTDEFVRDLDVKLAKVRQAMAISKDEIELNQGSGDEQLLDIFNQRKAEELDLRLMAKLEQKLATAPASEAAMTVQDILGLRYWLPAKTTATELELNGGQDPVGFTNGAANLTVATAPRWAHAVCGFDKLSDDDLFRKLHEYRVRVNTFVPEGSNAINTAGTSRQVFCQTPVFLAWAAIQTIANDNLHRDVGMFRDSVAFMSTPVKVLHSISTPGSPARPTTHGLLYDLDPTSFEFRSHPAWNFALEEEKQADTPDVKLFYRQAYIQLACKDREKNLVAYTDNEELYELS